MDKAVEELQQELKVLKNEIKETLTDVREVLLNTVENPFPQDLTSRSMSMTPQAPQAAPRPNPQPEQPPAQNQNPQQGSGGGYQGGGMSGPVMLGNMGGGPAGMPGMPGMPQMPNAAPNWDAMPGVQSAAYSPAAAQQEAQPTAPASDGPGLPPPGARRERQAAPGRGETDGPGLPPRGREAGRPRSDGGEEPAERERDAARGRRGGSSRPGPQRRQSLHRSASDTDRYERDDGYEEPYENEDFEDYPEAERPAGKVDLVVLASLSPWLSEGIRRIGRKRVKAVLDIYASMGGITREMKDVLVQIVDMDDTEGSHEQVSVQDSMRMLIELDDLMWRGRQDWRRAALMTMLSGDERLR